MQMSNDGGDTWWDVSLTTNSEFHSKGNLEINWKERGYGTILDILMVNNDNDLVCEYRIQLDILTPENKYT